MRKVICDLCRKELPANHPSVVRIVVETNTPMAKLRPLTADICLDCIKERGWLALFDYHENAKAGSADTSLKAMDLLDTILKKEGGE